MVEVSGAFWMQLLVSAVGILIMIAAAGLILLLQPRKLVTHAV